MTTNLPYRPGADLPDHPRFLCNPEPKRNYDIVIVGADGHGLSTAHYLAKNHGITNVAVLDKGWLGGGNLARNTTLTQSNYLWTRAPRSTNIRSSCGRGSRKTWATPSCSANTGC
jgi:sarcosine oxidase subunit beta